jgi:hydroxyethylthiazole kinase-like uncharacterized protein yjeF
VLVPLFFSDKIKEIESRAIENGYFSEKMIDKAAFQIYRVFRDRILNLSKKKCLIISGSGNNGKDGFILNKILLEKNIDSTVYKVNYKEEISEKDFTKLKELIENTDIIVDALLGIGQKEDPKGSLIPVINFINYTKQNFPSKIIVSIDCPTGVNSDSGNVYTPSIKADCTICVEWIKPGLLQEKAKINSGNIYCTDTIGLSSYLKPSDIDIYEYFCNQLDKNFKRQIDSHKGKFGKVFAFVGESQTQGASFLVANSAYEIGAPLVYLVESIKTNNTTASTDEIMKCLFNIKGFFQGKKKLSLTSKDIIVIGPGFGTSPKNAKVLKELLSYLIKNKKNGSPNLLLDADCLSIMSDSNFTKNIKPFAHNIVITPHPKEAANLLKVDTSEIQKDRFKACSDISKKFGGISVLLKGTTTIFFSEGKYYLHSKGSPALSMGGSGDALCGIIAGVHAQSQLDISFAESINIATYLHSISASKTYAVKAGDIAKNMKYIINDSIN